MFLFPSSVRVFPTGNFSWRKKCGKLSSRDAIDTHTEQDEEEEEEEEEEEGFVRFCLDSGFVHPPLLSPVTRKMSGKSQKRKRSVNAHRRFWFFSSSCIF